MLLREGSPVADFVHLDAMDFLESTPAIESPSVDTVELLGPLVADKHPQHRLRKMLVG